MKSNKGITLIALVITIVVLIILAGVAISLSLGENGIFSKAKFATEEYANEQEKEETEIGKITNEIESHVDGSRETVTTPTGTKFDTYICNNKTTTSIYSQVTSMTSGGFVETRDENNKISEYISDLDTDGYTVLKSGWYFVRLYAGVRASNSSDTFMYFYIKGNVATYARAWASGGYADIDTDSFSIYLEQGDNIYFAAQANGTTAASSRDAIGYIYPMF